MSKSKKVGIMPPQDIPAIEDTESVCEKIQAWLKEHKKAFSIQRLMIDAFGRKESDILGSFKDWPDKSDIALYNKIMRCLKKLQEDKKVIGKKVGKPVLYWWAEYSDR